MGRLCRDAVNEEGCSADSCGGVCPGTVLGVVQVVQVSNLQRPKLAGLTPITSAVRDLAPKLRTCSLQLQQCGRVCASTSAQRFNNVTLNEVDERILAHRISRGRGGVIFYQ